MGPAVPPPRVRGEVGSDGVVTLALYDIDRLFDGIPLGDVTTSMTINCTASIALAMYLAVAEKQGVAWSRLGGTMQNDMLKERSEEHTSELQSLAYLVCRLLLEKKKTNT